jgi:hypothetical protein
MNHGEWFFAICPATLELAGLLAIAFGTAFAAPGHWAQSSSPVGCWDRLLLNSIARTACLPFPTALVCQSSRDRRPVACVGPALREESFALGSRSRPQLSSPPAALDKGEPGSLASTDPTSPIAIASRPAHKALRSPSISTSNPTSPSPELFRERRPRLEEKLPPSHEPCLATTRDLTRTRSTSSAQHRRRISR